MSTAKTLAGRGGLPLSASVLAAKRVRASDSRPPCHWWGAGPARRTVGDL